MPVFIDGVQVVTAAGDLIAGARLVFTTAISKIIPGATSLSLRNNADNADNLLITDAGAMTARNRLTVNQSGAGAGVAVVGQTSGVSGIVEGDNDVGAVFRLSMIGSAVAGTNFGSGIANQAQLTANAGSLAGIMIGTFTATPIIFGTNNAEVGRAYGDGGWTIGTPTGTDKGAGTLNVQGTIWQNGVQVFPHTTITNTLGGDVGLASTNAYWDGPSCAQGTAGTWMAFGQVTVVDTGALAHFKAKLWDGTTVFASADDFTIAANDSSVISLSGIAASPAANLRISVQDSTAVTGSIKFNLSGNSKDSTLSVIRIG